MVRFLLSTHEKKRQLLSSYEFNLENVFTRHDNSLQIARVRLEPLPRVLQIGFARSGEALAFHFLDLSIFL